jgi:hypothetical protein
MNFQPAATTLLNQVGGETPAKERDRALLWIVMKYVPANSSDREIALLALGRIEGVAAMLAGVRDATG